MNIFPGDTTTRLTVGGYKVFEHLTTQDSVRNGLEIAYQSAVYGNSEPPLIRMGKGFHESAFRLEKPFPPGACYFLSATILYDKRMDSWEAQIFRWDMETYLNPILFVAAKVRVVDGA